MATGSLVVLVAGSLLSGCAAPPPEPVPSPVPSLTQEQQDDAAFRDVMTRYVDLDANTDTEEDLAALLTGDVLDAEKAGLADARQSGIRTSGKDAMSGFEVTDRGLDPSGTQYMTAQLCLDQSGTRFVDSSGKDMTPERDPRLSLQVKVVKSEKDPWRVSDIVRNEDVHACG
ncbi:hypothetical protein [Clavibacter sp. MX14-G9D]|uniref:hypothetical protein n=1 Tax=Clavibacter sp. MX14-G9D TaxID=3064656 RepID=UPI00293E25F8|nr:hypothetical protein [Clavibacter sp. MX14-G9D]